MSFVPAFACVERNEIDLATEPKFAALGFAIEQSLRMGFQVVVKPHLNALVDGQTLWRERISSASYKGLFFGDPLDFKPTIADVHTQPTDEFGAGVGRILHVATGYSRLMITTVNTCMGPRAYAGLVSSYFEQTKDNWKRLTDAEWKAELVKPIPPAEVTWMTGLVSR